MLQIIVFATLFGVAMSLAGEAADVRFFEDLNAVIVRLVWIIIEVVPYGAFALIARAFAKQGFDAVPPLLKYFLLVLMVLLLHGLFTYPLLLKLLSGLFPRNFLQKCARCKCSHFPLPAATPPCR